MVMRLSRSVFLWLGMFALLAGSASAASAQELEPNNSCFAPQDGGTLTPPAFISGSIDAANATFQTDVDFYRFTATPGQELRITVGFNQRAGLFNESCVLQNATDF